MIQLSTKRGTTKLFYDIYLLKERELRLHKQKVLELEKSIEKGFNNSLCNKKYNIVSIRHQQLKKTIKNLKMLRIELDKLNF